MILYRKEPYHLQMRNIILLDDEESGGVLYVSKQTYDQALILSSRLDGDYKRVIQILNGKATQAYITVPGLPAAIDKMAASMPEPINILAPFLMYCWNNKSINWTDSNLRVMCYGILHQYSQMIDFNAMTLVPTEVRANISFPSTLLLQYETSWNELCSTLEDKVVFIPNMKAPEQQQTSQTESKPTTTATPTVTAAPKQEKVETKPEPVAPAPEPKKEEPAKVEENTDSDDPYADLDPGFAELLRKRDAMMKATDDKLKKKQDKKKDEKKEASAPTPAPAPAAAPLTTKPNDAKEASAVLDEFDF